MASLHPGESVKVKIVLAKPDSKWAVAASAEGRLFLVQVETATQPPFYSSSTTVQI